MSTTKWQITNIYGVSKRCWSMKIQDSARHSLSTIYRHSETSMKPGSSARSQKFCLWNTFSWAFLHPYIVQLSECLGRFVPKNVQSATTDRCSVDSSQTLLACECATLPSCSIMQSCRDSNFDFQNSLARSHLQLSPLWESNVANEISDEGSSEAISSECQQIICGT